MEPTQLDIFESGLCSQNILPNWPLLQLRVFGVGQESVTLTSLAIKCTSSGSIERCKKVIVGESEVWIGIVACVSYIMIRVIMS